MLALIDKTFCVKGRKGFFSKEKRTIENKIWFSFSILITSNDVRIHETPNEYDVDWKNNKNEMKTRNFLLR